MRVNGVNSISFGKFRRKEAAELLNSDMPAYKAKSYILHQYRNKNIDIGRSPNGDWQLLPAKGKDEFVHANVPGLVVEYRQLGDAMKQADKAEEMLCYKSLLENGALEMPEKKFLDKFTAIG